MFNFSQSCYFRYKLKIGATKRTQTDGFQVIDAEKWFKHEKYDENGFKNDIALIKMKTKFKGKNLGESKSSFIRFIFLLQ